MVHRMVRPVIKTIKHYVHRTNVAVASAAIQNNIVAESVAGEATASAAEVKEGSIIKAVYIELWLRSNGTSGQANQFLVALEKVPSSAPLMTAAQSLNLGAYPNKKNILYTTQGVLSGSDTSGIPVIRQFFLIPKGKQRMGLSDRIVLNFAPLGQACQDCGFFTYKEYL